MVASLWKDGTPAWQQLKNKEYVARFCEKLQLYLSSYVYENAIRMILIGFELNTKMFVI